MTRLLIIFAALGGLALACGDSDDSAGAADTAATATTAGTVEAPSGPSRIVSLSPSGTEMLFAIGAGDQVVAVDSFSYYPAEAPVTDLSGYQPNVEAVADYEPDFVLLSDGTIAEELMSLGIEVLVQEAPVDLDGVYDQIAELGIALGHEDEAAEVVAEMRAEVAELLDRVETPDEPLTYFHELDDTYYTVTSATFIGQIYSMAGLVNIADPADADGAAFGYPQLSPEFIFDADPDVIFLADAQCCGQSADTVAARPGWDALTAVRDGRVVVVDEDIASRWSPRIVEYLRAVVDAVAPVTTG